MKSGTVLHLCNHVAISLQDLAISDVEVVLENMDEFPLVMVQVTPRSCGFEMDWALTKHGPIEQLRE